ncbi:MAG: beta-galactosidase trimerization domain-containing protein [Elusimicrobiota bacterium]
MKKVVLLLTIILGSVSLSLAGMAEYNPQDPVYKNITAPFLWEADTSFSAGLGTTTALGILDNLQQHGVNLIWVQVEHYGSGEVYYKKTALTGLTCRYGKTPGDVWEKIDPFEWLVDECHRRGMKIMVKLHGSNHALWDANESWRKRGPDGQEVWWASTLSSTGVVTHTTKLKNFCCNAPYWETVFFKMEEELLRNYNIDGVYLDTCQAEFTEPFTCYCQYCKARFKRETGKDLPKQTVLRENWDKNPDTKLWAIKRVEWVNQIWERFGTLARSIKPDTAVMLNLGGEYTGYSTALDRRYSSAYVTHATPEPVNTPRVYAVRYASREKKAGLPARTHFEISRDTLNVSYDTYGSGAFISKMMIADADGKPAAQISRDWFTTGENGLGPIEIEVGTIESNIAGGAKGFMFFGYLAAYYVRNRISTSTWMNDEYIKYLQGMDKGLRKEYLANSVPAYEVGILWDRETDFWMNDYWNRFAVKGGVYCGLQHVNSTPTGVIGTSQAKGKHFSEGGYNLKPRNLQGYKVVIAPQWLTISGNDAQVMQKYVLDGGNLILMGPLCEYDDYLIKPAVIVNTRKYFGISVNNEVKSSTGSVLVPNIQKYPFHPVFRGLSGEGFSYGADVNTYEFQVSNNNEILAYEQNDGKTVPAVVAYPMGKGRIVYINAVEGKKFSPEMHRFVFNTVNWLMDNKPPVIVEGTTPESVINFTENKITGEKFVHIMTVDNNPKVTVKVRLDGRQNIKAAQVCLYGSDEVKTVPLTIENGYGVVTFENIRPYYLIVKI